MVRIRNIPMDAHEHFYNNYYKKYNTVEPLSEQFDFHYLLGIDLTVYDTLHIQAPS